MEFAYLYDGMEIFMAFADETDAIATELDDVQVGATHHLLCEVYDYRGHGGARLLRLLRLLAVERLEDASGHASGPGTASAIHGTKNDSSKTGISS